MISLEEMRELLPDDEKDMSDEKLAELRAAMYETAELAFDVWLSEQNEKKNRP